MCEVVSVNNSIKSVKSCNSLDSVQRMKNKIIPVQSCSILVKFDSNVLFTHDSISCLLRLSDVALVLNTFTAILLLSAISVINGRANKLT